MASADLNRYLLIAYLSHVAVYAASTSLLVRSLPIRKGFHITAMVLSQLDEKQLYILSTSGLVELWDWMEGEKLDNWNTKRETQHLGVVKQSQDNDQSVIFTTRKANDTSWQLSAHLLQDSQESINQEKQLLFTHNRDISSLQIIENATIIVMTSENQVILGSRSQSEVPDPTIFAYTWRIVKCPEWISSIDIRVSPVDSGKKIESLSRPAVYSAVDIVVGGLKGAIHIYDDLLRKLIRRERHAQDSTSTDIHSRHVHWHRNAVLTVKWSKDGNYVISGGQETVLVLWQLETGRKETLPHLGAPIQSVVVSPRGSSYAVRLADNSAMILSTSELKPIFSVAGIQALAKNNRQTTLPSLPKLDNPYTNFRLPERLPFPICTCPSRPGQLLIAAPAFTSSRSADSRLPSAAYLQTFDIGSSQQMSRQALVRTNITNLNIGPESNMIEEPCILHIAASYDGQWLASVDEWMPPKRDIASLAFDSQREYEEQFSRQEVYLKLWSWNDNSKTWELNTRIDDPHASPSGDPYQGRRVLALASDPVSVGFSTFGEDGSLKAWKPVSRHRSSLAVKGKDGQPLTSWRSRYCVPVTSLPTSATDTRPAAKMIYSPDSSIIVLGLQQSISAPIYLLDSFTGEIQNVQTGLSTGPLLDLGVVDRYLIVLSDNLIVWNLVSDELHYGIDVQLPSLSLSRLMAYSHLAIDAQHKNFAISVPEIYSRKHITKVRSRIATFGLTGVEPLFVTSLPNPLTAFLPAHGRKGYYTVDLAAEVRMLTPAHSLLVPLAEVPTIEKQPQLGLNGIFAAESQENKGRKLDLISKRHDSIIRPPQADGKDEPFVSKERLAEIFDQGPAYALPPVEDLFEQVAKLFIGRPQAMEA